MAVTVAAATIAQQLCHLAMSLFHRHKCPGIRHFDNSRELFAGLVEIISLAESKDILEEYFKDFIDEIYK